MIGRPATVLLLTLSALTVVAGPASAGGRPDPPPAWLGDVIVTGLSLMGIAYLAVVVIGAVQRRQR